MARCPRAALRGSPSGRASGVAEGGKRARPLDARQQPPPGASSALHHGGGPAGHAHRAPRANHRAAPPSPSLLPSRSSPPSLSPPPRPPTSLSPPARPWQGSSAARPRPPACLLWSGPRAAGSGSHAARPRAAPSRFGGDGGRGELVAAAGEGGPGARDRNRA